MFHRSLTSPLRLPLCPGRVANATARNFSLWPSAPVPPPLDASASSPTPPSLSELSLPLALPPPTFFEPASSLMLSLPPALSLSYTLFIPLITLFIRTTTTLPLTIWQRARTRKFAEVVMPLIRASQTKTSLIVRDECRRAGKTFEEYQEAYKKRAKADAKRLAREHSASPLPTLLIPPMLHIPIFIGTTLVLRDACARALEALPLSTSSLASLLPTSPDSLLSPAALSHLHELASTSFLWCPSLILPDPTMALPLAVGLAAMLNVEVTAVTRRANAAAARALDEVTVQREQSKHRAADAVGSSLSAAEQRRLSAKRARMGQGRGFATATTRPQVGPPGQEVVEKEEEPRTARIMTNVLRGAAVCFIPVAAFAPSAVCLYWLTSNTYTLVQNLALAVMDRRREKQRRVERILARRG